MKPSLRKEMAYEAVKQKAVSIRFACLAFQISETCYRYQHQNEDDNSLIADWLIKLISKKKVKEKVLLTIALGLWGILKHPQGLSNVEATLAPLNLMKASSNWLFAALSYVGFCMLWLAGFMGLMGSSAKNLREVTSGAVLGAIGFSVALFIIALGLLANMEFIAGSMVPTLKLAASIHPMFATVFSVIVLAGIYTTAVPLLWQASARFTDGKSTGFKALTVVLTLIGVVVGLNVR